ncbi:hypothetical protein [Streptomyces sp. MP131-18]|uniref:hypothetical protein n=1 Tax=Streptomyces sp. MP131-18 TaxID=1857892 RepID=UPI00097BA923|nr:hypothetical protein [Streptomyces sp. MP131-18]
MGPLQLYEVQVDGYTTRMRLNAADAERLGGVPVNVPEPVPMDAAPKRKQRTVANKAQQPANKATA